MRDFTLRLFNFPAEKIFKPRQRLSPVQIPENIAKLLPFKEEKLLYISEYSDFVLFIEYFAFDLNFDNINDFKEYFSSSDFYL